MTWSTLRKSLGAFGLTLAVAYAGWSGFVASPTLAVAPAVAQTQGQVPGNVRGNISQTEIWRAVRKGIEGQVSIPDKKAGVLVQSEGDNLRAFRNGPLSLYGAWLLLVSVVLIALFFALRGRIKIDAGPSGQTVERFDALERFTHWLTASSFILLALTGLNLLYGKFVLMPIIGQKAFAAITLWGKYAHNYLGFAFMLGVIMMFVLWVRHNLPNKHDLVWLAKGGGLFVKGVHPPAKKFNAGQKLIFWLVIIGGGSLGFSGFCLLFPFEINPWAATFKFLNVFGLSLPTTLTPLQETQLSLLWHGAVALVMIAIVIGHIYIGSLGMEGAIDAVGSGQVDENWAREHHSLWFAELKGEAPPAHH
jgi:formate dehydrogenase subunit gamma